MFFELSKILPLKPRHAEQTDTRQGIQRHDPDHERKRGKKQQTEEPEFNETGAIVAVEALRIFLEEFLQGKLEESEAAGQEDAPNPEDEPQNLEEKETSQPPQQQTNPAAIAASAYEATAHAGEKTDILLETTDQAGGPPLDLSAADIRTIHALIEDLDTLIKAGVETLHIERADTFLESLKAAIGKIKAML